MGSEIRVAISPEIGPEITRPPFGMASGWLVETPATWRAFALPLPGINNTCAPLVGTAFKFRQDKRPLLWVDAACHVLEVVTWRTSVWCVNADMWVCGAPSYSVTGHSYGGVKLWRWSIKCVLPTIPFTSKLRLVGGFLGYTSHPRGDMIHDSASLAKRMR